MLVYLLIPFIIQYFYVSFCNDAYTKPDILCIAGILKLSIIYLCFINIYYHHLFLSQYAKNSEACQGKKYESLFL